MSDIRLTTTPVVGLRRLAAHGQPVVAMHRQLATILGNRLGRQHAQLLAHPEANSADDPIDWYSPPLGAVRRLTEVEETERRRIETLCRQLIAEIGQLAAKMRVEGESAALVAYMLELALITPPNAPVYAVGPQPVLVLWGYATEAQPVPEPPAPLPPSPSPTPPRAVMPPPADPPAAQPPQAAAETSAAAAKSAVEETVATAMAAPPAQRGWAAWLLPLLLLLLLAFLVWRALQPLAPIVVERPAPPAPPAADPLVPEMEKEAALRAELAKLTQEHDQQLAMCKPVTPVPPPAPTVAPSPPPPPPQTADVPLPQPKAKPPAPEKAEMKPKPQPKPVVPKPEAKPAQPQKPEKKPPATTEPPETVAVAPPVPPAPPKSRCALNFRPGDEPEVILVVDASGSMEDAISGSSSRMAAAKGAIEQVVGGLPPEVEIGLIDFTDCNQIRVDDFYPNARRPALIGQVRGLQPERRTALARSLERAGSRASSSVDSTIVVVTDGEDSCDGDPCAVAASIRRRKPNVTINVIDVSGSGNSTAQCIARNGGGKVLTPNSAMDMKTKVQQATGLPDTRTCK